MFRDVVLQPGEPLQSELDLRLLSLTYGYSFWHGEKLELAATLGITSVEINAQAKVATEQVHVNETETAAGPFPTPGIAATWVVSKHFYLDGRVQYLNLHINDLDGSLGMGEIDALYRLQAERRFRLGYTEVKAHVDIEQEIGLRAVQLQYQGTAAVRSGLRSRIPATSAFTRRARCCTPRDCWRTPHDSIHRRKAYRCAADKAAARAA